MTDYLFICESGLLAWLVWNLQPYARPAFTLLILVMLSATGAYHIPRPASEFQASQTIQGICVTLAIVEGILLKARRQRVLTVLYSVAFGALFVIAEKGLDQRFGWFITAYTVALTFELGMAVGAFTLLWDRHIAWLAVFCTIKPIGALAYWFLPNEQSAWWAVNNAVMGAMAAMCVFWILVVPIRSETLLPETIATE